MATELAQRTQAELLELKRQIAQATAAKLEYVRYNMAEYLYPDTGPRRRELYKKHMDFYAASAQYAYRVFLAANQVGKTLSGGYEVGCHATGQYPHWWQGRAWDRGTDIWVWGDTGQTVRDTVQLTLMGPPEDWGSGILPKNRIVQVKKKGGGVPDLLDSVTVRHASGRLSRIGFKSYDQGMKSAKGTKMDVVWGDEEMPLDVFSECAVRLLTRNGIFMLTFTPVHGLSELVLHFMPHLNPGADEEDEMEDDLAGRYPWMRPPQEEAA